MRSDCAQAIRFVQGARLERRGCRKLSREHSRAYVLSQIPAELPATGILLACLHNLITGKSEAEMAAVALNLQHNLAWPGTVQCSGSTAHMISTAIAMPMEASGADGTCKVRLHACLRCSRPMQLQPFGPHDMLQ